jgi:hypothetical protein
MLIGFGVRYSWGASLLEWDEVEVPNKLIPMILSAEMKWGERRANE